jgi:hypothetical protein
MKIGTEPTTSSYPADASTGLAAYLTAGSTGEDGARAQRPSRDLLTPAVQRVIEWHRQRASAH